MSKGTIGVAQPPWGWLDHPQGAKGVAKPPLGAQGPPQIFCLFKKKKKKLNNFFLNKKIN
jgi:hypothetical protein